MSSALDQLKASGTVVVSDSGGQSWSSSSPSRLFFVLSPRFFPAVVLT